MSLSVLSRGLRRNRSVKGTRGERVETGAMNTWEWKGMVSSVGVKVRGCLTDVLAVNVSVLLSCTCYLSGGGADDRFVIGLACV